MNNIFLSYCITACDENEELFLLLSQLEGVLGIDTEIIVQTDSSKVTKDVLHVINNHDISDSIKHVNFPLNGDFATFKNNLFKHARGEWIFQIDADELLNPYLLYNVKEMLEINDNMEMIAVPRVNIVDGLTQDWINQWKWGISKQDNAMGSTTEPISVYSDFYRVLETNNLIKEDYKVNDKGDSRIVVYHKPIINFPDYQTRIYRNKDSIRFKNKVHEVITGYSHYSAIPSDWDWCLLHVKSINKQINQNEMYAKL